MCACVHSGTRTHHQSGEALGRSVTWPGSAQLPGITAPAMPVVGEYEEVRKAAAHAPPAPDPPPRVVEPVLVVAGVVDAGRDGAGANGRSVGSTCVIAGVDVEPEGFAAVPVEWVS